ncbi:hypothetical protein E2C01_037224 [Portunus trituberculatus]|uniref:Uncharacterized protein n=1 Tax=Portunus trituberculatus TaxID=210409 RepID=A0A5B7FGH9_PORTR|nr:hypothetical protein [Portunus trituberculatus]
MFEGHCYRPSGHQPPQGPAETEKCLHPHTVIPRVDWIHIPRVKKLLNDIHHDGGRCSVVARDNFHVLMTVLTTGDVTDTL